MNFRKKFERRREKFLFNYFLAQLKAKIAAIWKHVERNESLNDGHKLFINLLNT